MLQKCKLWKIDIVWECDSSFLLDGLANAATRGTIEMLIIPDKIIVESKIAQLKKVWKITKHAWMVMCSGCEELKENVQDMEIVMARQGWNKMFTVIKHIQTKKHQHYKMCKAVSKE